MPPISLQIIGPYYIIIADFCDDKELTYNSCIIYSKDGLSVYKFIHRHKCQLEINSH